jgi:PhoH-like ATPase
MPLPKAPSKPASLFTLTDDVRARPIRNKVAKPTAPVTEELEGSFQPDLLDPVRARTVDSNDSPATEPTSSTTSRRSGARAALLNEPAGAASAPVKPRRGSKSVGGSGIGSAAEKAAEINAKAGIETGLEGVAAKNPVPPDTRAKSRSGRVRATSLEPGGKTLRPRLFVLDTNVLMHDPTSLFRFEEHDIFLPMVTLEELDNNKKGMTEVARNARQASRSIEGLIGDLSISLSPMRADSPTGSAADAAAPLAHLIEEGVRLDKLGNREATGRLRLQTTALPSTTLPSSLASTKADNQILGVVHALQERWPNSDVVLVSKDINMRIKARALGLRAEDYFNDQVVEDTDLLYSGVLQLPADFWDRHGKGMESWQQGGVTYYRITGPLVRQFLLNQFVWFEGQLPLAAQVRELNGSTAVLQTLRDFGHHKNSVWGISARNREQNFALNLLTNPDVDFVSLLGQAGTGKTLLALAAGLSQVLESKRYSEIIMTRATVPVGEDIGYLPGTEEEKMQPWMGALEDNLEVLNKGESGGDWGRSAANDLIKSRVKVKSMSFMRGRTFLGKYLIIDEAQNLTPKQMKTLVTRAGPGTKVICLGNIAQIDTPYLTEGSSGLTYVVDRFKGWGHAGHITLQRGERSRLADYAADAL